MLYQSAWSATILFDSIRRPDSKFCFIIFEKNELLQYLDFTRDITLVPFNLVYASIIIGTIVQFRTLSVSKPDDSAYTTNAIF